MKGIILLLASAALAVLLVSSVAGAAATITFAPAKNFPAGDDPRAVAAADLDKDGDTDIMTVHNAIDRVSVLKRLCLAEQGQRHLRGPTQVRHPGARKPRSHRERALGRGPRLGPRYVQRRQRWYNRGVA